MNDVGQIADLQIGYIKNYDLGKHRGVLIDPEGESWAFTADDIIGTFPILDDKPWVSFKIVDERATEIMFDPSISQRRTAPRRGLAIFGAAKCPECDWRIPAVPERDQSLLRKKNFWARCPECSASIVLKSMTKGFHNFVAVLIWVVLAIGTRILFVESSYFEESLFSGRGVLGLLFYLIMFLSLFFLYFQEKLIRVDVVNDS